MSELWERQPDENPKPFEAFCVYRDLGPGRSLAQVAEKLSKSEQLIRRWSSAYEWVKRAAAWDGEQDRIARVENLKAIKEMRKRHARIALKALQKVDAALDHIDPAEMGKSDVARLMSEASKLERISRGDVGDVVEERDGGEAINPVQIYIPSNSRERGNETFDDIEV